MSEAESALQAVRSWCKEWADSSALTDEQVIVGHDAGGRPSLPYLSVYVTMMGGQIGHDETVHGVDGDGEPTYYVQGERRGTAGVHGYGEGSETWLEALSMAVHDPGAVQQSMDDGIVIGSPLGGVRRVPRMTNANLEPHFVCEFPITYRVVGPTRTSVLGPPVEETVIASEESESLPLAFSVLTP